MLKEFFVDANITMPFKLFGKTHLACIIIVILGWIIITLNRHKLRQIPISITRKILLISAIIMLINMIVYNIAFLYFGIFDYKIHLPFHLCFISGYIFMYAIFFKKEKLLKITYFLSVLGPIPAIIWPEFQSTFNSFEFYEYFISHHFFLLISLFAFFALKLKIEKKDVLKTIIIATSILVTLIPFNHYFKTNYIFSSEIPAVVINTIPFIKHFHPIIILLVLAIFIISLMYLFAKKTSLDYNCSNNNIKKLGGKP